MSKALPSPTWQLSCPLYLQMPLSLRLKTIRNISKQLHPNYFSCHSHWQTSDLPTIYHQISSCLILVRKPGMNLLLNVLFFPVQLALADCLNGGFRDEDSGDPSHCYCPVSKTGKRCELGKSDWLEWSIFVDDNASLVLYDDLLLSVVKNATNNNKHYK